MILGNEWFPHAFYDVHWVHASTIAGLPVTLQSQQIASCCQDPLPLLQSRSGSQKTWTAKASNTIGSLAFITSCTTTQLTEIAETSQYNSRKFAPFNMLLLHVLLLVTGYHCHYRHCCCRYWSQSSSTDNHIFQYHWFLWLPSRRLHIWLCSVVRKLFDLPNYCQYQKGLLFHKTAQTLLSLPNS